ncbi:MAG TPA: hypothetical protein VFV87_03605 [Pirellulaceae bacterium]|nr:hypothetical protein [Pirellulaceae bacterium]
MSGYPQQHLPGQQPYPAQAPQGNPFAEQVNPYAAPPIAGYQPQMAGVGNNPFAGLWRQGNVLVMHKLAPLPDICLLSNQPATRRLKRTMYWHNPLFYIIVLISPLIYIIVALIVQKNATIQMPLTEEWYGRRQRRMLFAWGAALAGAALIGGAIALSDALGDSAALIAVGGILLALGGLIYGLIACRLVTPERITDQYVFIKGVNHDFLNRLEPWMWNV